MPKEEKQYYTASKQSIDVLPEHLKTPEFIEAWKDFVAFRAEPNKKRKGKVNPLTPLAAKIALGILAKDPNPVATLHRSILASWDGIFPENKQQEPSPLFGNGDGQKRSKVAL